MTYRWSAALRDALIYAEVGEITASSAQDDPEMIKDLSRSMIALAAIPLNSVLKSTEEDKKNVDVEGDVEPGPTWAWVNQLVDFYFSGSHTVCLLEATDDVAEVYKID